MININDGTLKIDDALSFYPGFRFEDFKKTKYYNGQDEIRVIYLDEKKIIDGRQYIGGINLYISLYIRLTTKNNKRISSVKVLAT